MHWQVLPVVGFCSRKGSLAPCDSQLCVQLGLSSQEGRSDTYYRSLIGDPTGGSRSTTTTTSAASGIARDGGALRVHVMEVLVPVATQ